MDLWNVRFGTTTWGRSSSLDAVQGSRSFGGCFAARALDGTSLEGLLALVDLRCQLNRFFFFCQKNKDGRDAFDQVLRHMHANDLRVVTEIFTWRVLSDLLENKPMPPLDSAAASGVLVLVPPLPPVSSESLLRGSRSSHSVSLETPDCVDPALLFSLLCRSLVLICGCAVRDRVGVIPSAFASSSSQKNMVLTRALREKTCFIVEVSEVRYMRLGLPGAPDSPQTAKLLGFEAASESGSDSKSAAARRQLRPDALAIASFATQLHRRNIVRAV